MRYLFVLIYSSFAFSLCDSALISPLDGFIEKVTSVVKKPWAAASEDQIKKHVCQTKYPSLLDMKEYLLDSKDLDSSFSLLINSPKSYDMDEVKTDLSAYGADKCIDTVCKAQKVFGESEGIELLYMLKKYGLNGSHLVHKDTKPWTSKMLKPYLKGMASVPKFMLPINKNQRFTKSSKDSTAVADAMINFYNGVTNFSDSKISYTTFHELSHYISGNLHVEDDQEWFKASNWIDRPKKIEFKIEPLKKTHFSFNSTNRSLLGLGNHKLKNNMNLFELNMSKIDVKLNKTKKLINGMQNIKPVEVISRYAETNPLEDIAESMTAYRFNASLLKETSPSRYQYLKENVFMGAEYLDDSNCIDHSSKREAFLRRITK